MREFLRETIIEMLNDGLVALTKGDFVRTPVTGITFRRDNELNLLLELRSRGWGDQKPERHPAGTVRSVDDAIEFRHAAGWTAKATGVIERDWRSHGGNGGEGETIETYSAHSIQLNLERHVQPAYVVEWITNIPSGYIWTENIHSQTITTSTTSFGSCDPKICIRTSSETSGGSKALHLNILGVDIYVASSSGDKDCGYIIYHGCQSQEFRDKIRACLSFVLGKPMVYLGYTEYCSEWIPVFMKSVDAFSSGGAFFKLYGLPPYPINDKKYANVIDQSLVSRRVTAILQQYDSINFNNISWAYWSAMCAPVHAAAIHFGSLIEHLQRNCSAIISVQKKLIDDASWNSLDSTISSWLRTASIDPDVRKILKGKIASLNQAPQNIVLRRLLNDVGIQLGKCEINAWKHRNMAAHGAFRDEPIELILNAKVLRVLFHRMLAGISRIAANTISIILTLASLSDPLRMAFLSVAHP